MNCPTLFEMPPKAKKTRKPFKKTQQWTCKRCKYSAHDATGAYCDKFDLCLEFDDGRVFIVNGGMTIVCDGEKLSY